MAEQLSDKLLNLIRETISDVIFEKLEFSLDVPPECELWDKSYEEMTFEELIQVIEAYADDEDELIKILSAIERNGNLTKEEREYLTEYVDSVDKPLVLIKER